MARWEKDILKDIRPNTYYKFTVDQPVDMKFGRFKARSFINTEEGPLVHLIDDADRSSWYNVFQGVWIDIQPDYDCEDYKCNDATHASWLRLIRSFLEERLDPKEIMQAEKLELKGCKLVHRYTGGWCWVSTQEEASEEEDGDIPSIQVPEEDSSDSCITK